MSDHPWEDVLRTASDHVLKGRTVFQKWTCAGCGRRLMSDDPNVFTEKGTCDHCGHTTDIKAQGHNYLLSVSGPAAVAYVEELSENSKP